MEAFLDLRVEGLCVVGVLPYDEAFAEAISSVPAVVTSSHSYELPHVDSVVNDDEDGTRQATEHLIGLGHQRIAHIGGGPDGVAQARLRGYQRAMREHGLDQHIAVEECDYDEPSGYAAASRLLGAARPPTAIVAVNDLAAVGAMSAAGDAGLPLPAGLSVTGYDNTSLAAVSHLSLSSVDPRSADIRGTGRRRIMARIAGGEQSARDAGRRDLIPPVLVVRRSTTHPRSRPARQRRTGRRLPRDVVMKISTSASKAKDRGAADGYPPPRLHHKAQAPTGGSSVLVGIQQTAP